MKRVFEHPPEEATGRQYWRSLEQFADTPEFRKWAEEEFPSGGPFGEEPDGVSRRHFLRIMGASMALAGVGLSGCRRPESYLVTYRDGVEWVIPGKPLMYSTSMPRRSAYIPMVATTHEGRPTKVEGNPLVPGYNGGTDGFAQASILDLYDPDRLRQFRHGEESSNEEAFLEFLEERREAWEGNGGRGLAFLVEENNSPTRDRLRRKIQERFPEAVWASYEPLDPGTHRRAVTAAYGPGTRWQPRYDQASVVLALDSDFLGNEEGGLPAVKAFSDGRRLRQPDDEMNRLYSVESRFSITGGCADHRLRLPAGQVTAFGVALARRVHDATGDGALGAVLDSISIEEAAVDAIDADWVQGCAEDLLARQGEALIVAGRGQTAQLHALVLALNAALGGVGTTVQLLDEPISPGTSLEELADQIRGGGVTDLVVVGGNPAYNAPVDLDWEELQTSVDHVVCWTMATNETSEHAEWQIPAAHYLESWGDGRAYDGTLVPVQPMILPLFKGWSELTLWQRFLGEDVAEGPELIRETFQEFVGDDEFEEKWTRYLREGFFPETGYEEVSRELNSRGLAELAQGAPDLPSAYGDDNLELVLIADYSMDDGRYANNGWLQEAPDPITRLTWENAALISPATARKLGVRGIDPKKRVPTATLRVNGRELSGVPVMIVPGLADGSVILPLGFGRRVCGYVGLEAGVDAYRVRSTENLYVTPSISLELDGGRVDVATTQDHHSMEGRHLVREGTLDQYRAQPDFAKLVGTDGLIETGIMPQNRSLYPHPEMDGLHQWAMSIDLSTCIGCNACVLACQSENNIPIVGRRQVVLGREMHWIRNDRYFSTVTGYEEEPQMLIQPVTCMMCENAPCETVCPVNATVHNEEGLNVMTYNRCIGTRYCANNCPYKVRRFNYFDYNERPLDKLYLGPLAPRGMADTLKMQKNPNVTVRMRGVMEKCTYCVQRIESAKITAKVRARGSSDVRIPTDTVRTACQSACPAEAIVFGDINDPNSRISQLKTESRDYVLLKYLNVRPRTSYLAKIRNPYSGMPDADRLSETTAAHVARGEKLPV